MRRGDIGLCDEGPRDALVEDLLPQRREETFRHLRMLFERLRAANVPAVQSPRAVESTETGTSTSCYSVSRPRRRRSSFPPGPSVSPVCHFALGASPSLGKPSL